MNYGNIPVLFYNDFWLFEYETLYLTVFDDNMFTEDGVYSEEKEIIEEEEEIVDDAP